MSVFVDWSVNRGDLRIQLALLMFRIARLVRTRSNLLARIFGKFLCFIYLVIVEWTWGIELPWATSVGPRLRIFHGSGIVINANSRIGADVVLRQGVCIGSRVPSGECPIVEDGAELGAGAIVLGNISLGRSARIGAGAVVLIDVPEGRAAAGNPAKLL